MGRSRRIAVAALLVLAGCTGEGNDPAPGGKANPGTEAKPTARPAPTPKPLATRPVEKGCTWEIGSMAPFSGQYRGLGLGIDRAVQVALMVANADPAVPCKLELVRRDTRNSIARAIRVGSELAARERLVACVCGTYSGEVLATGRTFEAAGILQTGPATDHLTTKQGLTTWFQASASHDVDAEMAARYMREALDAENVALVHDGSRVGRLRTSWAGKALGDVAGRTFRLRPGSDSYPQLARAVAREDPDVVYFDGELPEATAFVTDLRNSGSEAVFFGGDSMHHYAYTEAGDAARNTLVTCTCIDAARTPAAEPFADLHREKFNAVPILRGAEAYDVTTFIARALRGLTGREDMAEVRRRVVAYFARAKGLRGVAKTYGWNDFGKLTNPADDVWVYEWSDEETLFLPRGSVGELLAGDEAS